MSRIKAIGLTIFVGVFVCVGLGCSDAAKKSSQVPIVEQNSPEAISVYTAQALLGPLRKAKVELYPWPNVDGAPIYTTLTSDNADDYAGNGLFEIPENVLIDGDIYIIRVSGGEDIDADINGVMDSVAVANQGVLHAVLSAKLIKKNNFSVSILTELVYQRIAYMLAARYDTDAIQREIDRLSRILIKTDINGDNIVDGADLVLWKPNKFKSALFLPDEDFLAVAEDVRKNIPIIEKSVELTDYVFAGFRGRDSIRGTAVAQKVFYFTNGDGLNAFDISNPIDAQALDLSAVADANILEQIYLENGYLFAATTESAVRVYDLNFRPYKFIAGANLPAPSTGPQAIVKYGTTVYILQTNAPLETQSRVHIYTLDVDFAPSYIDSITVPQSSNMLVVSDNLYFTTQVGLAVYNLQQPLIPQAVGNPIAVPGYLSSMLVKANYLLASNGETGLSVFNISTPAMPQLIATENFNFMASQISLRGDIAYLENAGLMAMDVSDPNSPRRIGKLSTPGVDQFPTGQIVFENEYAYIPMSFKIAVANLDVPGDHVLLADVIALGSVTSLGEDGDNFYVMNYTAIDKPAVSILDMTDPASPNTVTSIPLSGRGENMLRRGDYIYVATGRDGVAIIKVADPAAAAVVKTFANASGVAVDVAVFSNYAFVADRTDGLEVYDISDPVAPVLINTITSIKPTGQMNRLAIKGNILMMFDSLRLLFLNISNPTLLNDADLQDFIVKELPMPGNPNDLRVFADKAFVIAFDNAVFSSKIISIDVSNPSAGVIESEIATQLNAFGSAFDGRFLYVGEFEAGLRVYDYADISNPQLAYIIETPGRALDVRLRGDFVYVADNSGGLKIYKKIVSSVP